MGYTDGRPGDDVHRGRQRVLNEDWPLRDGKGRHARGIPDQPGIEVEVRVVLEQDGEVWLTGIAMRWTKTHVWVNSLNDARLPARHLWVRASDVRRRVTDG